MLTPSAAEANDDNDKRPDDLDESVASAPSLLRGRGNTLFPDLSSSNPQYSTIW